MSRFRVIERKSDGKYLVQEQQYRGDYDGRYLCWVDSTVKIPKKLRILYWDLPYSSNTKAIFKKEDQAKDYILDRVKQLEEKSDKIIFEV